MEATLPFWVAMRCESLTLTPAAGPPLDDWDIKFDDLATATNIVRFDVPTLSGNLNYPYIGGSSAQRRFELVWDAAAVRNITVRLSGSRQDDGTPGVIQVKMNGVITEYTLDGAGAPTEHIFDLRQKAGRNRLVLCTDYYPFATLLEARLIDTSRGDVFVDSRSFPTFRR